MEKDKDKTTENYRKYLTPEDYRQALEAHIYHHEFKNKRLKDMGIINWMETL